MSNTYNALIHAKQDGTGEEVANNLSGGGGSDLSDYAKQEELSNLVLTGATNTSGATIAAGTCFVLNGDFVTAKADIASGATFTLNTNYEKKSVGSILTELNSNKIGFINEDSYTGMSVHGIYIPNSNPNSFSIGNGLVVLFGGRTTNAFAYILTRDSYAIPILQTSGVSVSVSNNVATITNNTDTGMRVFYMKMTE